MLWVKKGKISCNREPAIKPIINCTKNLLYLKRYLNRNEKPCLFSVLSTSSFCFIVGVGSSNNAIPSSVVFVAFLPIQFSINSSCVYFNKPCAGSATTTCFLVIL